MIYEVEIDGRTRRVEVDRAPHGYSVSIDGHRHAVDVTPIDGVWSLILGSPADDSSPRQSYEIAIQESPPASGNLTVHVNGRPVAVAAGATRGSWGGRAPDAGGSANGPQTITAPMPGRIARLLVNKGDTVAARQGVVVVEAMKMENELRAPRGGTVAEVKVSEGASVEAGTVLVVIE